ncbi:MAG: septum formation initiator [Rikenellaceae bacterium]
MKRDNRAKKKSLIYIKDNLFTLVVVVSVVFMLYIIGRNAIHAIRIRYDIEVLAKEAQHYQDQITRDSTIIENLKSDVGLERYARENFFMQRKDEEIFILEGVE